ncbi:MAG TPA: DUF433 domain-containing protein [Planctomycetota bacterium]|nr:DUF433 domain-containing protein [Planctomycetota bacterium]
MATVDIGTMIWHMPTETGPRACIAGTGTSVKCVASWYKMGKTPEEILVKYEHLTLAQIYAALAYYHANRDEIEAAIENDERAEREGAAASTGQRKTA